MPFSEHSKFQGLIGLSPFFLNQLFAQNNATSGHACLHPDFSNISPRHAFCERGESLDISPLYSCQLTCFSCKRNKKRPYVLPISRIIFIIPFVKEQFIFIGNILLGYPEFVQVALGLLQNIYHNTIFQFLKFQIQLSVRCRSSYFQISFFFSLPRAQFQIHFWKGSVEDKILSLPKSENVFVFMHDCLFVRIQNYGFKVILPSEF